MTKLSELLTQIFPAAIFDNKDLETVLSASALRDIEVPDGVLQKFNQHYMTADRAANDPEISKILTPKIFGRLADQVEREMKAIVNTYLPDEWKTKYYAIPETQQNGIYDRQRVLKEAIASIAEKGTGDDVKTLKENYRKLEKDLRDNIKALEGSLETEKTNSANAITKEKLNYVLRSKINSLIPKLDQNLFKTDVQKNFLIDSTINGLHSGYSLEFDKENPDTIAFRKKDGTDVYEGNTKVTLESYLEKQVEPFTVKNGGGTTTTTSTKQETKVINTNNNGVNDVRSRRLAAQ